MIIIELCNLHSSVAKITQYKCNSKCFVGPGANKHRHYFKP